MAAHFRLGTTRLAAGMLVIIWTGIYFHHQENVANDRRNADHQVTVAANLVEEKIVRAAQEADKALLYLRRIIETEWPGRSLTDLIESTELRSSLIMQLAVTNARGDMLASSTKVPEGPPINLGDRHHFLAHVGSQTDELVIGAPVVSRLMHRLMIPFSRPLRTPSGEFAGIITAAANPERLLELYERTTSLQSSEFVVAGDDGIVRLASRGAFAESGAYVELASVHGDLAQRQAPNWAVGRLSVFKRPVGELPLHTIITLQADEIYAASTLSLHRAIGYGVAFSVVIFGAAWHFAGNHQRLLALQAEREAAANRLSLAVTSMSQGLAMFDRNGRLLLRNQQFCELYNLTPEQVPLGMAVEEIVALRVANGIHAGPSPEQYRQTVIANSRLGQPRIDWLSNGRAIVVSNVPTADGGWLTTHEDVTARETAARELERLANVDLVTSLANRRALTEQIAAWCADERRFALLCFDLDDFKPVNDTYGHHVGDELLHAVGRRLQEGAGDGCVTARLGGDEFAILLPLPHGLALIADKAEQLLAVLKRPFEIHGHRLAIGASLGIAVFPEHGRNRKDLLRAADLALYAAKDAGRNTARLFVPELATKAETRHKLARDLDKALADDQLHLAYQPVIDLKTGRTAGYEALLRWNHPQQGPIGPAEFIPLAEESGRIHTLGGWALATACRVAAAWDDEQTVAVNISPVQFTAGDVVGAVRQALISSGLPPHRLEIEVTENVLLEETERNLRTLENLKALGVSLALDDFGIGYSSLSYLRKFKFDKIKIDRFFIASLAQAPDDDVILRAILDIARTMNLKTTAEGVETAAQLEKLQQLGCTQAQGYLLGRPGPGPRAVAHVDAA
jgi:diguanylate cyclase (GGDEF)-like protein